jgi:hypothetical protein
MALSMRSIAILALSWVRTLNASSPPCLVKPAFSGAFPEIIMSSPVKDTNSMVPCVVSFPLESMTSVAVNPALLGAFPEI